jgi:Bacterial Ig-like domain (group 3)/Putative Ig domain
VATIFKLSPEGSFSVLWNFAVPYIFPDGTLPTGLVEGDDGNFYGTTAASGGAGGVGIQDGTVFRLTPDGLFTTIAVFPSDGSLGAGPGGQMVEGPDGAFYGTTDGYAYTGFGIAPTIFRVTKDGDLSVLHTLSSTEGISNLSSLILGSDGKFYGVAPTGGDPTHCNAPYNYGGCGTLFSVTTAGAFQVLYSFTGGTTGAFPNAVIQDSASDLVGVAGGDGQTGSYAGVVFKTTFPTSTELGPIQISLFKQSDMSPVTTTTILDPNTPLVLKWNVTNGYSNTMRQCFAYFLGDNTALGELVYSQPDWQGKQLGVATSSGYSGQTVVTPAYAGHFSYSLSCGGSETGVSPYVAVQNTLAISTSTLPGGVVGQGYSQTLMATGGTAPYTWSIASGTLPPGLSYNAGTGTISGTPKQFGNYTITFQAKDSSSPVETSSAVLTIAIVATIAVNPGTLPSGVAGTSYNQSFTASGGIAPYTFALTSGTLPKGLTFNAATATISGTPTAAGTASLGCSVTDSENPASKVSVAYSLTIAPLPLAITNTSLPAGLVGAAYSQQLNAVNGTAPYTWALTSGTLPKGLGVSASTGFISGTPVQFVAGSNLVFQVADSSTPRQTALVTLSISVASGLSITTAKLPQATQGINYSVTLAATGGITPYKWSVSSGTLPAGLTLDPVTGEIAGIPNTFGSFKITLQVSDSEGTPATSAASFTMTVLPPPPIATTTTLASSNTAAGAGMNVTFTAVVKEIGPVPTGTVTFLNGTTSLGMSTLDATGTATLTTSFSPVGVDSITASYGGSPTSAGSVSAVLTQTAVKVGVAASIPGTLTIKSGQSGTLVITIAPTGGYTGTVNFSCGTLPSDVSCTFVPPSLTITAGSGPVTDTLSIHTTPAQTATLSSQQKTALVGSIYLGMSLWLPGSLAVLASIFRRSRKASATQRLWILGILCLGLAGVGTLTGCGGSSNDAQPGTYTIPVTLALANGSTQTVSATVVVQ